MLSAYEKGPTNCTPQVYRAGVASFRRGLLSATTVAMVDEKRERRVAPMLGVRDVDRWVEAVRDA